MSEVIHGFRGSKRINNLSKEYTKKWTESLCGQAKRVLIYSFMSPLSQNTEGVCAQVGLARETQVDTTCSMARCEETNA